MGDSLSSVMFNVVIAVLAVTFLFAFLSLLAQLFRRASAVTVNTISLPIIRKGNVVERIVVRYSFPAHSGPVRAVAWSPNGKYLAATEGARVRIWHMTGGQEVFSYAGHAEDVCAIAWSPTKPFLLISGGADHSIQHWSFRLLTGETQSYRCTVEAEPLAVAWAPTMNTFVGAGNRSIMLIAGTWPHFEAGTLGAVHPVPVQFISWSPDGRYVASVGCGGTVYLWETGRGRLVVAYPVLECEVTALAFSPEGNRLAVSYSDGVVRVWNSQPLPDLPLVRLANSLPVVLDSILFYGGRHTGKVNAVAWSSDGRAIASGGDDTVLRIWDATTGMDRFSYVTTSPIISLSWSPSGKLLAVGLQSLPLLVMRFSTLQ